MTMKSMTMMEKRQNVRRKNLVRIAALLASFMQPSPHFRTCTWWYHHLQNGFLTALLQGPNHSILTLRFSFSPMNRLWTHQPLPL